MPPSSNRAKEARSEGVASVTQDMSSARLKILGDLMETRKRAEQHEQEFLRSIHSENAAFSHIVSMFEGSLDEIRGSISNLQSEHSGEISDLQQSVSGIKTEVLAVCTDDLTKLQRGLDNVEEKLSTATRESTDKIHLITAEIAAAHARASAASEKADDSSSKLSSLFGGLSEKVRDLHTAVQTLKEDLQCARDDSEAFMELKINQALDQLRSERESWEEGLIAVVESKFQSLMETRIGQLEEAFGKLVTERLDQQVGLLDEKVKTEAKLIRSESSVEANKLKAVLESRIEQLKFQSDSHISALIDSGLSKLDPKDKEASQRIEQLESELTRVKIFVNEKISQQESVLHAVATAGHRHDWVISSALPRLKSLGVLTSGGKFINSEQFSVGPYKNLTFRFYPVSAPGMDCPAIWLIHRPVSADAVVPVFVDIGLGSTRKGPLRAKKVQELFGHWVWEASFPNDVLAQELAQEDLAISVEVSMRQWMDPQTVRPAPVVDEEEIPDSPSRMSNFTFAPQATAPLSGLVAPVINIPTGAILRGSSLPDKALATPNPFEKDEPRQAVTPRRSSWAQFGSPDENTLVASNPFRYPR